MSEREKKAPKEKRATGAHVGCARAEGVLVLFHHEMRSDAPRTSGDELGEMGDEPVARLDDDPSDSVPVRGWSCKRLGMEEVGHVRGWSCKRLGMEEVGYGRGWVWKWLVWKRLG